jgi:hypothetical protein
MAYTATPGADVSGWDDDYKKAATALATETDNAKKAKLTAEMQALATRVEERLNRDIQIVRRNFAEHTRNVDKLVTQAQQELKQAQATAASYKKNPAKTELPGQIQYAVKKLAGFEQAIKDDAHAFGDAWKDYRANVVKDIPARHLSYFHAERSKIINDQKVISTKLAAVKGLKEQAEALVQIAGKATLKKNIKAGGAQRPITDAQKMARELAQQMDDLLTELRTPKGLATKPDSVTSGANSLVTQSNNKNWTQTPGALAGSLGLWKNAEAGYKLMVTKAAAMEKVLAAKKKAFRSDELKDATVKAELLKADQCLKDAKTDVKAKEKDYTKAKAAITKIQAAFKAAAKK